VRLAASFTDKQKKQKLGYRERGERGERDRERERDRKRERQKERETEREEREDNTIKKKKNPS
jgi:THO complex subunit 2